MKLLILITMILASFAASAGIVCPQTSTEGARLRRMYSDMRDNSERKISALRATITPENQDEVYAEMDRIMIAEVLPAIEAIQALDRCVYKPQNCDALKDEEMRLKRNVFVIRERLSEILRQTPQGEDPMNNPEFRELNYQRSILEQRLAEITATAC